MNNTTKLLDLARSKCDGGSYAALARRIGVTPQSLNQWKLGEYPMPLERIAEIAKIAGENADDWKILLRAEQSTGEEKKTWENVVRRLGIAAAIALAVGFLPGANASPTGKNSYAEMPNLGIMRNERDTITKSETARKTRLLSAPDCPQRPRQPSPLAAL